MRTIILFTSLLPFLAASTPITPRAGGPAAVPIPANCTIINPLPHASCGAAGIGSVSSYMPASNFSTSHLLYATYFDSSLNQTAQSEQCLEQCYGYGYPGSCKSALLAYQVPTPKGYFGTAGGVLETACLLYDAYLDPNEFVPAPAGQYLNETAKSIYCPS